MLAAFEETLVRLCVDRALRRRFASDPAALADVPPEVRALLPPLPAIERYARSLLRKRWDELGRLVPLTRRICPRLEARYLDYAADHPPRATLQALSPGAAEALRVLPALCAALDDGAPAYAADLLAFEILGACAHEDGLARTFDAHYDVRAIAEAMRQGELVMDPDPAPRRYTLERGCVRWS